MNPGLDIANFVFVVLTFVAGATTAVIAICLAVAANRFAKARADTEDARETRAARVQFGADVMALYAAGEWHNVRNGRYMLDVAWRQSEITLRLRAKHLEDGAASLLDLVAVFRETSAGASDVERRAALSALGRQFLRDSIDSWIEVPDPVPIDSFVGSMRDVGRQQ